MLCTNQTLSKKFLKRGRRKNEEKKGGRKERKSIIPTSRRLTNFYLHGQSLLCNFIPQKLPILMVEFFLEPQQLECHNSN